jgi:hypothetical protein
LQETLEVSVDYVLKNLLKFFSSCHSGEILAMAVCPFASYLATIGPNGRVLVHNYISMDIYEKAYRMEATTLVWIEVRKCDQS